MRPIHLQEHNAAPARPIVPDILALCRSGQSPAGRTCRLVSRLFRSSRTYVADDQTWSNDGFSLTGYGDTAARACADRVFEVVLAFQPTLGDLSRAGLPVLRDGFHELALAPISSETSRRREALEREREAEAHANAARCRCAP